MTTELPFMWSIEVFQASGMVSAQADCLIEEALKLMQDRATVAHVTLEEIAEAVLDHSIRFGQ